MDTYNKDYSVNGLDQFPDGAYSIRKSNRRHLDYNL